jgi:hypothetical protein
MMGKFRREARFVKTVMVVAGLLFLLMCVGGNSYSQDASSGSVSPHAIMRPDWDTLVKWKEDYKNAPEARIDGGVSQMLSAAKQEAVATSIDLLSYLDYTPVERDQGYCGNCWVWSGTGILEIADSVKYPADRKHRHSIQFLNSCKTDAYACQGGNLTEFSNWYRGEGYSIPWSNTKAYWQDYTQTCGQGTSSCVSCSSIDYINNNYTISSIQPEKIATQGISVGQDKAIANIKNILQQNRAVEFDFCLANTADWTTFDNWWNGQSETALLPNPDNYCGNTVDTGMGCHAVLLVGYNDSDATAANHYWILLNSWGTTTNRSNGLFRIPMVMNYDCTMVSGTPPNTVTQTTREFWTLNTGTGNNTLTVSKSGGGNVVSSDGKISCGSTCNADYASGTAVTLTATASSGSSFTGWGGACSGTDACYVTMNQGKTVTATFFTPEGATLTISKRNTNNGTGTVTSVPEGINCGSTCKWPFSPGDMVTLTAEPQQGTSSFTGWGGACSGAGTCSVTMNSNTTVSASFSSNTLGISRVGAGTGTVTSSPAGINCGSTCSRGFPPGASVTLSATPLPGSTFREWGGGACTGADPSCTFTMTANAMVTATFDLTCAYTAVSPPTFNYKGGYKTVRLTASNAGGGACPAPPISIDASYDWLSYDKVTFGNAKANKNKGSVRIRALSYTDSYINRDGTVNIGADSLTVNQAAKPCSLGPLVPPNALYDSPPGGNSFTVTPSPGDCGLTAEKDPSCKDCSWITISPVKDGAVAYSIEENATGKNRTGKIIVKLTDKPNVKRTFTIRQTR